jgi:hypothetical protein
MASVSVGCRSADHGQMSRRHLSKVPDLLIATVFNYSLDGLLAGEGAGFWKFCFDLPENRERCL